MPPRRGTPWASHGSLLSDRIRPPSSPQPTRSEKGKGKAKAVTPEPPTSSATVRRFDELLDGLRSSSVSNQQSKSEIRKAATAQGTDVSADHEGCFCQARIHALSEYTPLCSSCGLILCALHPPHRPCPHCAVPLLTPPARAALIAQLEEMRSLALREEAEERERHAEEMRLAEGAFPALMGSGGSAGGSAVVSASARGGGGGGHRVLVVNSRTKRVKVKSYSRSGLENEEAEEGVLAEETEAEAGIDGLSVPPPPSRDVEYVRVQRGPATRWVDLKGGGTVRYVALPAAA